MARGVGSVTTIEWLALAWVLVGVGAAFFAFVDIADSGEHAMQILGQAGLLTVALTIVIAAAFGPLTVWCLRHRL